MNLFRDLLQRLTFPDAEVRIADYYQQATEMELSLHIFTTVIPFLADPDVLAFTFGNINRNSKPGHIKLPQLNDDVRALLQTPLPHKRMWFEAGFVAEDGSRSHVACLAQQVRAETMAFIPLLSTGGKLVLTGMAYIASTSTPSEGAFQLLDLFDRGLAEEGSVESTFFELLICHFLKALHQSEEADDYKLTPISSLQSRATRGQPSNRKYRMVAVQPASGRSRLH